MSKYLVEKIVKSTDSFSRKKIPGIFLCFSELRKLRFLRPLKKRQVNRSMRTTTTEIPNFHQLLSLVRRGSEAGGGNYKQWRKG